ncbi:hypothetical protein DV738_g3157, partial [Chaetothyriales sp. CBS 135597]
MALSFFHSDQLVRGAAAAEIEQPGRLSRALSDEGGDDEVANGQPLLPHSLRKLHSETALGARARADGASPRRYSFAREDKAGFSRDDKGKEPVRPVSGGRAVTSYSYHSDSSDSLPIEVSRGRPMAILGVRKPSFLNVGSNSAKAATPEPERPKSSSTQRMSWRKKTPVRPRLHEEFSYQGEPPTGERTDRSKRTSASRANTTVRNSGGGVSAGIRTSQSVRQNPPRLFVPPKDSIDPAQFLAESLAHVIVGEWLYKDPNKPGLMPQANILQRHLGPPPRGSTGLPQKRWFRIDPYERLLTWSSKWDSAASAQHKARRRVPIKLVFEVSNRLVADGCIPVHALPHNESIVVVAPLQVLKITAPDETRHALWMTALQYLVDSKKIPAQAWPDVLAARLSPLSSTGDGVTKSIRPPLLPVLPLRSPARTLGVAGAATVTAETAVPGVVNASKPLPPTPSSVAAAAAGLYQAGAQTSSTAMTPPTVPRYTHQTQCNSDAELSTCNKSDVSGCSLSPSVKSIKIKNNNNHKSFQTDNSDMYASGSERQAPLSPAKVRSQQEQEPRQEERSQHEQRQLLQPYEHQHREHQPQEQEVATVTDDGTDDYEVDQMDELVAGLGNI